MYDPAECRENSMATDEIDIESHSNDDEEILNVKRPNCALTSDSSIHSHQPLAANVAGTNSTKYEFML